MSKSQRHKPVYKAVQPHPSEQELLLWGYIRTIQMTITNKTIPLEIYQICYQFVLSSVRNGYLMELLLICSGDKQVLPPILARTYFKQLHQHISSLHSIDIIHGDIALNNLILDHQYNLEINVNSTTKMRLFQAPELLVPSGIDADSLVNLE